MTSDAKRLANLRNAARSTGPRTAQGKKRVSQNALRHGLARAIASNTFVTEKVRRLANAIAASFDETANGVVSEIALAAAQAQMRLDQITLVQVDLYTRLANANQEENTSSPAAILRKLGCIERYVDLARGQRRKALLALGRLEVSPT